MTGETQSKGKVNAAGAISIGFIEKAWEFKWGIQLVYVVLYADAVQAWFLYRNLLSVTNDSAQIWELWEQCSSSMLQTGSPALSVSMLHTPTRCHSITCTPKRYEHETSS
jgi:hypothetical protein